MWALTLLAVLQAARANSCIRISYATDEDGAKTVSKSFAITARSPEACKKNQFSGLGPTKAFALEVSILKVLNEKRNASSYTTRKCRDRYFPRLLERNDPKRAFVQSWDGEPLTDGQHHNRQLCQLSIGAVRRFAHCASAVMAEARVEHLDSRVMLSAAKNTLIDAETKRLTLIDFDIASLYGFPRTDQLVNRQYRPQSYAELLTEFYGEVCGGAGLWPRK
ncbi:unnamed protein product [Pelagomonas calceolata]|uniref:Protein kinase domain-containing protein n=1 Tax=Pelagomonas calceolata TaxID=35677 RepID=A0A8J2T0L8_9STRA|nr:unnamed protein product [Pelagomonas calceolata]